MPEDTQDIYLEQIESLKNQMNNMVESEEYNKLKEAHDKLVKELVNRRPAPKVEEKVLRTPDIIAKEIKGIQNGNATNREYIGKVLEYRESVLNSTGKDVFTDFSEKGPSVPTQETTEVSNVLKSIYENSNNDADFRIKLNDVLEDDVQLLASLRRKK